MLGIGLRTIRKNRGRPVALAAAGQQLFTTPGTYTWVCPEGVTSVCAVAVGGGGGGRERSSANGSTTLDGYPSGGGGGGLGWKNNIPVEPGQQITVRVGAGGPARSTGSATGGNGGNGAVRVIWGGVRSFPNNSV
jgi:hypothetical protein